MTSINEREELKARLMELVEEAFDEGMLCYGGNQDYGQKLGDFKDSKVVKFIDSLETGEDKLRKLLRVNSDQTTWQPVE